MDINIGCTQENLKQLVEKSVDINIGCTQENLKQLVEKSIDFHCHGIGRFDFTKISILDLQEIETILAERQQHVVLTLYLPQQNFDAFLDLLDFFSVQKKERDFYCE